MVLLHVQDFQLFMRDDAELLRAADAQWAVVPLTDEVSCGIFTLHSHSSAQHPCTDFPARSPPAVLLASTL